MATTSNTIVRRLTSADTGLVEPVAAVLFNYKSHVRSLWAEATNVKDALSEAVGSSSSAALSSSSIPTAAKPNLEKITAGTKAVLANDDLGYIYAVLCGDASVLAVAVIHREVSDWRAGFVWYVNTVAVNTTVYTAVSLPPVTTPTAAAVSAAATEKKESSNNDAASAVVIQLVEGIRSDVNADETANGFRVMLEDPCDTMGRAFYTSNGQFNANTDFTQRADSSACYTGLLVDAVSSDDAHHVDNATAEKDVSFKTLSREHYFMMTWYKQ